MARGFRLAEELDFALIAKCTPGYVGADLAALVQEAAAVAVTRTFELLDAHKAARTAGELSKRSLQSSAHMGCMILPGGGVATRGG